MNAQCSGIITGTKQVVAGVDSQWRESLAELKTVFLTTTNLIVETSIKKCDALLEDKVDRKLMKFHASPMGLFVDCILVLLACDQLLYALIGWVYGYLSICDEVLAIAPLDFVPGCPCGCRSLWTTSLACSPSSPRVVSTSLAPVATTTSPASLSAD